MAESRTRFLRSETVADGTMSFHFARPREFLSRPGRTSCSETELMIATRMRDSAFKNRLKRSRWTSRSRSTGRTASWCCTPARASAGEGGEPIGEALLRRHAGELEEAVYLPGRPE